MEEEEYFVFVGYTLLYNRGVPDEDDREQERGVYDITFNVHKLSVQKYVREDDERFERVNVDFDPLGKQSAYLVYFTVNVTSKTNGHEKGLPKFAGAFLDIKEAEKFANEINNGKYRHFLNKKANEKYNRDSAKIMQSLISIR